jgi:hypothetical protein
MDNQPIPEQEPATVFEWAGFDSGLTRDQILSALRESREKG